MAKKRKVYHLCINNISIFNYWYSQNFMFICLVKHRYLLNMNIFDNLESNNSKTVDEFKSRLKEQLDAAKDSWILNGIYDYYLSTNSHRAVDVIVAVKEPNDKYFFDKSCEGIKGNNKLPHLTLLGYIVRKRPIWLYRISSHPLLKELLRLLKTETDIVTVVSALLIINILLPIIPGLLGPHLQDIFVAFSKLAAVNANSNNYHEAQLVHLQISLYTLFHRLYGMFPCNFVSYLRKMYSTNETSYPVFSHTVKPMLDTVRVHPFLISANEEWEISPARWKNIESHDIIITCAKFLMNGSVPSETNISTYETKSIFSFKDMLGNLKVTGKQTVADYCNELSKKSGDATPWSPSARYFNSVRHIESTPTMIPSTPISRGFEVSSPFSEHEGSSPPEAAVEATPETTPIRDYKEVSQLGLLTLTNRSSDSFSKDNLLQCSKVPISDQSFPSSPVKKEALPFRYSAPDIIPSIQYPVPALRKVNKLINDRHQASLENSIIELKPVGSDRNDLISNYHYDSMISTRNTSTFVEYPSTVNVIVCAEEKKTNAEISGVNEEEVMKSVNIDENRSDDLPELNNDTVDDFEGCEQEKSGSPCSSGGLHMPDNRSLHNFVRRITRIHYRNHCHSESGGFSTGTSPQDIPNYINDATVRRTNSCPEMKKNSPGSTFATFTIIPPNKQSVPEEKDEENYEVGSPLHKNGPSNGEMLFEIVNKNESTCEKINSSSQTEEIQPFHFPYEHLFLDVFPPLHPAHSSDYISPTESENSLEEKIPTIYETMYFPSKILQKYVDAAVQCYNDKVLICEKSGKHVCSAYESKFLTNQLKLMSLQLQFEEHMREMHAERNRRLLGRSRRNKTLEEYNNALKDQVSLLQKELENNSTSLQKIVVEKDLEIEHEQKAAAYWKKKFVELQIEHKKISDKCQEIEAQLKDEKKTNQNNIKVIYESKAALMDITNELKITQKEAKAAKDLRSTVAEYQTEILKAGEMIIRYRCRQADFIKTTPESTQQDLIHSAYVEEVEKLKNLLKIQSLSLDATKALITHLKKELNDKENDVETFKNSMKTAKSVYEKELKELQERYEQLKTSYNREVDRSNDLEYKLSIAKHLNKLSQPLQRCSSDYVNSGRYATNNITVVEGNSTSLSETSGILKSSQNKTNIEIDSLSKTKRNPGYHKNESNWHKSNEQRITDSDRSRLSDQKYGSKYESVSNETEKFFSKEYLKETKQRRSITYLDNSFDSTTAESVRITESTSNVSIMPENTDPFKSSISPKKKGHMECVETGQLKIASIEQLNAESSNQ